MVPPVHSNICDVLLSEFISRTSGNNIVSPGTVACQAPLSVGFSRQDTGVGCHFLLQGIFPTQESNLHLLHCRQILYLLSYEGSPWYQGSFQRTGCGEAARRRGSRSRLPKCLGLFVAFSGLQHLSEKWVNEHHFSRLPSCDEKRSEVPLLYTHTHTHTHTHTSVRTSSCSQGYWFFERGNLDIRQSQKRAWPFPLPLLCPPDEKN